MVEPAAVRPTLAERVAQRLGPRLRRSMQACVRLPSWLDPIKALWIGVGILMLKRRFMRGYRPAITTSYGFGLAGAPTDSTLNGVVFFRGLFEPVLSEVITRVVQDGDLCVDAGANVGYFTLLLASRVGAGGRVIAIEASPGNLTRITRNAQHNGVQARIDVVGAACTDHAGEATFFVNTRNDMHCRLALPGRSEADYWLMGGRRAWRTVTVPTDTLHGILGVRAASVSFIKLDIEGAEHLVVPDIIAHCTHERLIVALEAKAPHIRETLEPFERAGFHLYDLQNDYRWIVNTRVARPRPVSFQNVYGRRYMADMLLTRRPLDLPENMA